MAEDSFFEEVEAEDSPRAWMNDKKFVLVKTIEALKHIVDQAIAAKLCSLDLETNGLNTKVYEGLCHLKIAGFAISIDGNTGYYAPVNHIKDNLPEQPAYDEIRRLCDNCATVYHHCLGDITPIRLADGSTKYISEIVNKRLPVEVLSFNEETKKLEPKRVTNWFKNGHPFKHHAHPKDRKENWLEVRFEHKKAALIRVTPEHEFYTPEGKTQIKNLNVGDSVYIQEPKLTYVQEQLVLGSCLGDGGLCKGTLSKNCYFKISHSETQKEYIEFKYSLLEPWILNGLSSRPNYCFGKRCPDLLTFSTFSSFQFQKFWELIYNSKRKRHLSVEALERLDVMGLAFWFMDDGSQGLSFCTQSFLADDVKRAASILSAKFGVLFKFKQVAPSKNIKEPYILLVDGSLPGNIKKFRALVAPYIIPSMQYKITAYGVKRDTKTYKSLFDPKLFTFETQEVTPIKITTLKPYVRKNSFSHVGYDLEVADNHNYFANNILVSNSKYDQECLWTVGIHVDKSDQFEDTMVLAYLENDDAVTTKGKGLKDCAKRYLGMEMIKFDELFPHIRKAGMKARDVEKNLARLHPEEVLKYAACDAIITRLLFDKLKHVIKEQPLTYKIDKALIPALRILERNRVLIDTEYLKVLDKKVEAEMHALAEKIYKIAGYTFSFTAPREVGKVLFEKLKIKGGTKTKTGEWATKKDVLEKLGDQNPVIADIVRYKQLDTLRRRYIGPLSTNVDHLSEAKFQFDACRVSGGRFACPGGRPEDGYTGVNVQSTPKKRDETMPNLREAFIARPGYVMVGIDYDGQEMRIAANLSQEEHLIGIFNHPDPEERKPHRKLAQVLFHTKEPSKQQYAIAKSINFQTLYGGSGRSIAQKVGMAETEGMRMQKKFFEINPSLKNWIVNQKKYVKKHGYVKTYFGRIRRVPFAKGGDRRMIGYAERLSINAPIQGTAGDIMRLAIINLTTLIRKKEWLEDCRILLTIHDELIFEVKEDKLDEIVPELLAVMTSIKGKNWRVTLEASAEYGNSWASDKPFVLGDKARKRLEELRAEQDAAKEEKRKAREVQKTTEETVAQVTEVIVQPEQKEHSVESDWSFDEKETNSQLSATERKVVKEPEPEDKETYQYVVSDPLLRCKVAEIYEFIQKCPGKLKLVLLDERNTRLLPRTLDIRIDPTKFYELASSRGL